MGGQTQGGKARREKAGGDIPRFRHENCGIWCFLMFPRQGEDLREFAFAWIGENQCPKGSAGADFPSHL